MNVDEGGRKKTRKEKIKAMALGSWSLIKGRRKRNRKKNRKKTNEKETTRKVTRREVPACILPTLGDWSVTPGRDITREIRMPEEKEGEEEGD